jgi:hypothetical protein
MTVIQKILVDSLIQGVHKTRRDAFEESNCTFSSQGIKIVKDMFIGPYKKSKKHFQSTKKGNWEIFIKTREWQ